MGAPDCCTASATFQGSRPPARNQGRWNRRPASRVQSKATPRPPGRSASLARLGVEHQVVGHALVVARRASRSAASATGSDLDRSPAPVALRRSRGRGPGVSLPCSWIRSGCRTPGDPVDLGVVGIDHHGHDLGPAAHRLRPAAPAASGRDVARALLEEHEAQVAPPRPPAPRVTASGVREPADLGLDAHGRGLGGEARLPQGRSEAQLGGLGQHHRAFQHDRVLGGLREGARRSCRGWRWPSRAGSGCPGRSPGAAAPWRRRGRGWRGCCATGTARSSKPAFLAMPSNSSRENSHLSSSSVKPGARQSGAVRAAMSPIMARSTCSPCGASGSLRSAASARIRS